MHERNTKRMAESKRNILGIKDGFNTRVNLYIIKHLYYRMKKADQFMKTGSGKRKASIDLKEEILISRQRLDRIFNGMNFEMTASETEAITGLFNISKEYFKKDGELISIHNITRNDWECFFAQQYGSYTVKKTGAGNNVEGMKKVETALEEIIKKDYIESHYDTKAALYRIRYYFKHGVTYKVVSAFSKFLENLQLIKISDWKELEYKPSEMAGYLPLLKKHYEYVNAYLKCRELEKTD